MATPLRCPPSTPTTWAGPTGGWRAGGWGWAGQGQGMRVSRNASRYQVADRQGSLTARPVPAAGTRMAPAAGAPPTAGTQSARWTPTPGRSSECSALPACLPALRLTGLSCVLSITSWRWGSRTGVLPSTLQPSPPTLVMPRVLPLPQGVARGRRRDLGARVCAPPRGHSRGRRLRAVDHCAAGWAQRAAGAGCTQLEGGGAGGAALCAALWLPRLLCTLLRWCAGRHSCCFKASKIAPAPASPNE